MTAEEERVWRYLVANRKAPAWEVAKACNVREEFVHGLIDRISSPNWRDEVTAEQKPTRVKILDRAGVLTAGDRNKSYGPPEQNLTNIAGLWTAYIDQKYGGGFAFNAEDVAWMQVLLKAARSMQDGYHEDNYVDAAAYAGIAGECRNIWENE